MGVINLSFGGRLYADIWQCTLHLGDGGAAANVTLGDDTLQAMKAALVKWFGAQNISAATTLYWLKANAIDPVSRKYLNETGSVGLDWSAAPTASTSSTNVPPQLTICASLLTEATRGLAARGRFYPPPTSVTLSATGMIESGTRDTLVGAHQTLIRDLNALPGAVIGPYDVVVLGRGGVTRPVQRVRVGSVVDTQRRRRSALQEIYTERAI